MLNEAMVGYVVLGEAGETGERGSQEFRVLVADEDVPRVETAWAGDRGRRTILSVSGLPGFGFRDMAYFPPKFARRILASRRMNSRGWMIPDLEHRFLSRAYELVYHHGFDSGLLEREERRPPTGARGADDYRVLDDLRRGLDRSVELSLRGLHAELSKREASPPIDMLVRLGTRNRFCDLLADEGLKLLPDVAGLACFVVREVGARSGLCGTIERMITDDGFQILDTWWLDEVERNAAMGWIRGGDWGRGDLPLSGGVPRVLIFVRDPFPKRVSRRVRRLKHRSDNARVMATKRRIRKWYATRVGPDERCNMIHASDFAKEALLYALIARAERVPDLLEKLAACPVPRRLHSLLQRLRGPAAARA
jgi:hypothetical protein